MGTEGEIAELRAEVESLKTLVQQLAKDADGGGGVSGPEFGLPIVPLGDDTQGAFRWEGDKITQCNFQFGRLVVMLADVQASGNGNYCLRIPHDDPFQAYVIKDPEGVSSDLEKTVIPLFRVDGGKIVNDYRGMPVVPVRE